MTNQSINQSKRITNSNIVIHERKQKARFTVSFHIYDDEQWILEGLETLRRRDGWDQTRAIKEALSEYVKRHLPGNPSLPLEHWTKNTAFSPAAKEKLKGGPLEEPMPDYANMSIETLEGLLAHPSTRFGDRPAIIHYLKRKKEEEETL